MVKSYELGGVLAQDVGVPVSKLEEPVEAHYQQLRILTEAFTQRTSCWSASTCTTQFSAGCGEEGDRRLRLPSEFPIGPLLGGGTASASHPKRRPIDVGSMITW